MSWHRFEALVLVLACSAMVGCGGNGDLDSSVSDGGVSDAAPADGQVGMDAMVGPASCMGADVVTNGASACALDCDGQLSFGRLRTPELRRS